eukprot:scaffold90957_cov49-Attheya_sp.AAC.1
MPMRLTFGEVLLLSRHTLLTVMPTALPVMYIHRLYRATTSDRCYRILKAGVALFGEGVLSIVQNDATSHRTDIPSG